MTYLLFTDDPADTVDDIALTASVRTDDTGDTFIEKNIGFVGKTFETLDF